MLAEKIVIFLALVAASSAFECYTGRVVTSYSNTNGGFDETDCRQGIHYCLKVVTPNQAGGEIIEKSCDVNGICANIGNNCNMDPTSRVETCCCNGDKCNSAISVIASVPLMLLFAFLMM